MNPLIRRAQRRLTANELLAQGAVAGSAALGAFILLLLLGTQVLDWRWMAAIPSATFGAGLWLVLKRRRTPYLVAQLLDRRLDLADSISTAVFFEAHHGHAPAELRQWQRQQAERLAAGGDVRKAVPFTLPRAAYALAALLLVASSLFALRYGVSNRLDLKAPLARMLRQRFGWEQDRPEEARQARRRAPKSARENDSTLAADPQDLQGIDPSALADDPPPEAKPPESEKSLPEGSKKAKNGPNDQSLASQDEKDPSLEDLPPEDPEAEAGAAAPPGDKRDPKAKPAPKPPADNQYSSLLSKLQDAMKNLLSRLNLQPPTSEGEEGSSTESRKMARTKSKQAGEKGEKTSARGDRKQDSGEDGEPQSGDDSADAAAPRNPQAKGTEGKGESEQAASKQPGGSGIGSQEGAKNIRQAQQIEAMGKISEIIGKRSATVTGEATVEVQSTTQTLLTPYAQRQAQHAEAGAEIGRDEVPVAIQNYVEQYFEQVRRPVPEK